MDAVRLEYEMRRRNVSVDALCEAAGFSKSAYYKKRSGKSDFTVPEVDRIVKFLNLEKPVGYEIFFAEEVS